MKRIAYTKSALKALTRMPRDTANSIREKIGEYAADPDPQANNVKALKGWEGDQAACWRLAHHHG